jgi:hypothetical protein
MLKIVEAFLISLTNYMNIIWGNVSKENIRLLDGCIRSSAQFLLSKRKSEGYF